MARTQVSSRQVRDGDINVDDIDITTPGKAVSVKVLAGDGLTCESSGVDEGTGVVTLSISTQARNSSTALALALGGL